jgi:hypothetical protein
MITEHRRQYLRDYQLRWVKARRDAWFEEHGPCIKCGSWKDLELDHKDRTTKVDHKVWSWSQQRRDEELAKCQVLCKSCHITKTISELQRPIRHGSVRAYTNKKCRCIICVEAHGKRCLLWKIKNNYRGKYGAVRNFGGLRGMKQVSLVADVAHVVEPVIRNHENSVQT